MDFIFDNNKKVMKHSIFRKLNKKKKMGTELKESLDADQKETPNDQIISAIG